MYLNGQRVRATAVRCKDPETLIAFPHSVPHACQQLWREVSKHGMSARSQALCYNQTEEERGVQFSVGF